MADDDIARGMLQRLESDMLKAFSAPKATTDRAIRCRGGRFETVDLDAAGNIITPCPRCACRVVVCSECALKIA